MGFVLVSRRKGLRCDVIEMLDDDPEGGFEGTSSRSLVVCMLRRRWI